MHSVPVGKTEAWCAFGATHAVERADRHALASLMKLELSTS